MAIPLYIFALIYLFFTFIILVFIFINFSHLRNTGTITPGSTFITLIVFFLSGLVLFFTFITLKEVEWKKTVTIWNNSWLFSFSTPSI